MSKVGAVILAAGMSKRMGQPKLLMKLEDKPLFRHALEMAVSHNLRPTVFIGGAHIEAFKDQAHDLSDVEFVFNPDYEQGMASSVKLGVEKITGRAEAVLIFLADQPLVPGAVIQSLIDGYQLERDNGVCIVRPEYNGCLGHPILIDAKLFEEFYHIEGDQGGKPIIQKYRSKTKIISFDESSWGIDLDTPEEFKSMQDYLTKDKLDI